MMSYIDQVIKNLEEAKEHVIGRTISEGVRMRSNIDYAIATLNDMQAMVKSQANKNQVAIETTPVIADENPTLKKQESE